MLVCCLVGWLPPLVADRSVPYPYNPSIALKKHYFKDVGACYTVDGGRGKDITLIGYDYNMYWPVSIPRNRDIINGLEQGGVWLVMNDTYCHCHYMCVHAYSIHMYVPYGVL